MKKVRIIFIILAIAAAGVLYGIREFNRKPESTSEKDAIAKLTADSLARCFETNDSLATSIFTGKIVEVEGIIEEKDVDNGSVRLRLKGTDMSGVICQLEANDSSGAANGEQGALICIKGKCNLYQKVELLPGGDVYLNNCVMTEKSK
ncbi:MAG: OB-fold protein [Bacteroidota bacterium]